MSQIARHRLFSAMLCCPCHAAVLHPAVGVVCVDGWRRGADVCVCVVAHVYVGVYESGCE